MSIRDEEDQLFAKWRSVRERFVADGMVCEDEFNRSTVKIGLILKEVNDPDGGHWDLRDYIAGKINNGPRKQTWQAASRWISGINMLPEISPWSDIANLEFEAYRDNLKSIIAVNMNKSPGGHTSEIKKLWEEGNQDKEYFAKQLSIYTTEFLICCGSTPFWFTKNTISPEAEISQSRRGIEFFVHSRLGCVVKFSHPEARVSDNVIYYALMDFIREFKEQQLGVRL